MRNDKSQVIGLARKLAGKTEDGSAPVDKVDGERELVTQVTPILMSRPLWSSVPAQVQWTDALQGVEVNDLIIVQTRGVGQRVGIALATPKSLSDKFESEQVGTVNGQPLNVGGNVDLDAGDVGALPVDADLSHNHSVNLSSGTCRVTIPGQTASKTLGSGWSSGDSWDTARNRVNDLYSTLNALIEKFNAVVGASAYCDGCADAGNYSTSQGG